jgi:hypothetical protein
MSALRYNDYCVECKHFKAAYRASINNTEVEKIIETMKCKPLITEEQSRLLILRERARVKKEDLQRIIEDIDENITEATEQLIKEIDKKYSEIINKNI